MRILLSNDDGIHSPGLQSMAEALQNSGADVTVVAPERERSTTGHSLTLHKPVRIYHVKEKQYAVSGTPADCVYLATRKIMEHKPDLVVSGINRGANLGNDHYYSGTVAAAREAVLHGIPSIGISLCITPRVPQTLHWSTANNFLIAFLSEFQRVGWPKNTICNINIPNIERAKIKGVRISHQGTRKYSDEVTENTDPRGRKYYWVGGSYLGFETDEGSDCVDVEAGYISIVPLKIDTTDYELKEKLKRWEHLEF